MSRGFETKVLFLAVSLIAVLLVVSTPPQSSYTHVARSILHPSLPVSGVVVPHHDIVATLRSDLFAELVSKQVRPKTVILVSPNHFSNGRGKIQTTDKVWEIGSGQIQPDDAVINELIREGVATNETESFTPEHGIYNLLNDIHTSFPDAQIVPIILTDPGDAALTLLERTLRDTCHDCLLVASVDFSHYQPALLAQLHDERSIRGLQNLDTADLRTNAEVDSGPSLALLTLWAKDHRTEHFVLWDHTNSGIMSGDHDLETTTHVFGWYERGDRVVPEKRVSFMFGGDVMFARTINRLFGANFNDAFSRFSDRVFWGTDAGIVNLEGAITEDPIDSLTKGNGYVFQFYPRVAETLAYLHVNAASLANNHSMNAGATGVLTTRSVLEDRGIQTFGGANAPDTTQVATMYGEGLTMTVIGVNLTFTDEVATSIVPFITELSQDPDMRVVIMPHWGVEYEPGHTNAQSAAAHAWIDAGADMVIGSHPHVVEDIELYRNAPIVYSLGNLLFDQNFSRATQEGLLIAGSFTETGITFFGLPTQSVGHQPELLTGTRKAEILDTLYQPLREELHETEAGTVVRVP